MADVIRKTTPIGEAKEILDAHFVATPMGWEIVMGMILSDCDYVEVVGFGSKCVFVKHTE